MIYSNRLVVSLKRRMSNNQGTIKDAHSRDGSGDHIPSFAERINRLSKKRRELIRPVQEHPRDYVLLPIRDVASKLGTDPATVLRIARGLGFASYRNFKVYLHELSIASATSLEVMRAETGDGLQHPLARPKGSGTGCPQPPCAAQHPRPEASGGAGEENPQRSSYPCPGRGPGDQPGRLSGVSSYSAWIPGHRGHYARPSANTTRNCGKRDLVIAISFRRGLRQTVEGLRQAHANGAYCVGITDTFISPIARFADECFLTPVEAHLSNSYTVPMSFLNVLLTVCAHQYRARTVRILKKADQEQRHGFRWYRSRRRIQEPVFWIRRFMPQVIARVQPPLFQLPSGPQLSGIRFWSAIVMRIVPIETNVAVCEYFCLTLPIVLVYTGVSESPVAFCVLRTGVRFRPVSLENGFSKKGEAMQTLSRLFHLFVCEFVGKRTCVGTGHNLASRFGDRSFRLGDSRGASHGCEFRYRLHSYAPTLAMMEPMFSPNYFPGTYKVIVEAKGFKKHEENGVPLRVELPATVNVQMKVGAIAETISVTAEAPPLNTTDASHGPDHGNE